MSYLENYKDEQDYQRKALKGHEFNKFYRKQKIQLETRTVYEVDFKQKKLIRKTEEQLTALEQFKLGWTGEHF